MSRALDGCCLVLFSPQLLRPVFFFSFVHMFKKRKTKHDAVWFCVNLSTFVDTCMLMSYVGTLYPCFKKKHLTKNPVWDLLKYAHGPVLPLFAEGRGDMCSGWKVKNRPICSFNVFVFDFEEWNTFVNEAFWLKVTEVWGEWKCFPLFEQTNNPGKTGL